MPNPKRRHSKSRRDKRRTHDRLPSPPFSICQQCGEPKFPHRVCTHCGSYKGRVVVEMEVS